MLTEASRMADPVRHLSVFKPRAFGARRVDVIGCGATGSMVVELLGDLGVENIHAHDFDRVEGPNIRNQAYRLKDIGRFKVEALQEIVREKNGAEITIHTDKVTGESQLGEIVFLLVDTTLTGDGCRKAIWDGALKYKLRTKLVIETRMGVDNGRVYTLNPNKRAQVNGWEKTLRETDRSTPTACRASVSVCGTAKILAGFAVWQMIRWFAIEQGGDDELDDEIIWGLRSPNLMCRRF